MDDLAQFQKFGKRRVIKEDTRKDVWCYTRVSSKDQESNYSLENQKNAAINFSLQNGYQLVKTFGGTYESGKDDFTRKEFSRLLGEVKQSKKKPFAIIVYKMNRFSRSGGKSIALVNQLVYGMKVHLIEIVSGINTTSEKGMNELNKRLLAAEEENLSRLEHTIPGMKSLLKSGKRIGTAPLGYDHFGPKVVEFSKRDISQKIILNQTGKILRNAWQWKTTGITDAEIIRRLKEFGITLSSQRLSDMWRNVFYCGLIANKLLDGNVIEGKHEAMISKETFLKVQKIIDKRAHGYTINIHDNDRPLNGHLYCSICGNKLTSYLVKAKGLNYYKCQQCNGVSINAKTSNQHGVKVGAHELFINLLDSYKLNDNYLGLLKLQLNNMIGSFEMSNKNEETVYKKQMKELSTKKNKLEERYVFGEIDKELYIKFLGKVDDEISELRSQYELPEKSISNLTINLDRAIDFTQNISKYWLSGNLDHKRMIQRLVFPDGLVLDVENRKYLTKKVNALFSLTDSYSKHPNDINKKIPTDLSGDSLSVARGGLEPPTS